MLRLRVSRFLSGKWDLMLLKHPHDRLRGRTGGLDRWPIGRLKLQEEILESLLVRIVLAGVIGHRAGSGSSRRGRRGVEPWSIVLLSQELHKLRVALGLLRIFVLCGRCTRSESNASTKLSKEFV